jgi:hypothetical protein
VSYRLYRYGPLPKHSGFEDRIGTYSECPVCGVLALDHPYDFWILSCWDEPFLHVLCNGDRVKL